MRGFPPFEAPDGKRSPAAENPFALIQYALRAGGVHVIRFDATVEEVKIGQAPPAFTCTSPSKLHTPTGTETAFGPDCPCGVAHGKAEECAACGSMVPYHDFPGRGLKRALLVVNAPVAVGEDLQGPGETRDAYLLITVPRPTLDAFDEKATRRIIVPGNGAAGLL